MGTWLREAAEVCPAVAQGCGNRGRVQVLAIPLNDCALFSASHSFLICNEQLGGHGGSHLYSQHSGCRGSKICCRFQASLPRVRPCWEEEADILGFVPLSLPSAQNTASNIAGFCWPVIIAGGCHWDTVGTGWDLDEFLHVHRY